MLQCIVVTPEQTLFDQKAEFVTVTLFDGELGIGQDHTPMIGRLGFGEMRVRRDDHVDRYYIEGGFVEVLDDVVSVLTHRAIPSEQIDPAVVREHLYSAQAEMAKSPEALATKRRIVETCRAQLLVAERFERCP